MSRYSPRPMSYDAMPQPAWIPVRPRWQRWALEPAPATPVKWKVSPTDGMTPRPRRASAPEYVNNINRGTSAFIPPSRSRQIQQEIRLINDEYQQSQGDTRPPLEKKTSSPRRYDWAQLFGKQRRFSDSYFLESLPETTRMRRHSLLSPQVLRGRGESKLRGDTTETAEADQETPCKVMRIMK